MHVNRIIADLHVADIEKAKSFYTDFLGLSSEAFNMGWVARFSSPDSETVVQLVTGDKTAPTEHRARLAWRRNYFSVIATGRNEPGETIETFDAPRTIVGVRFIRLPRNQPGSRC